jgi:hypothetical protein
VRWKALSIVNPGGSRIATGQKTVEVRRWAPPVVPLRHLLIVENRIFLREEGQEDPAGCAVAIVDVVAVCPWTMDLFAPACATRFEEGYLAWHLGNVRPIADPFLVPARRGIYELDLPDPV